MGRRNRPLRGLGLALALTATMLAGVGQAAASTDYPGIAFFDPARGLWTMDGIGEFYYGNPGDRPLLCDWNGNGTDTVGLYRSSTGFLHLRHQNNFGIADISIFFGVPEDIPVCGDWDGDGDDTIGVYRPSTATFYLHNGLQTAYADIQFQFGPGHGVPIAGDWNGDGIDTVGLWQPWNGSYQLATQHSAGGQWTGQHGQPGDRIVVEDFDADGRDSLAVHRPSTGRLYVYGYGQQPGASTEFDPGSGPGFTLSGWTGGAPLEPEAPPPAPDPPPPPSEPPPAVPPGAVSVWPGDNIQAIVDSHPDGTTFYIRSGTHRMQRVRPRTGNTFIGEPGAVLNGSKVLTGWNRDGNQWWVGGQTQQGSVHGVCESYAPRCAHPEDLFIDGVRLEHVSNRSQVGAGKWFFDYGADRIYLGQDPGGKTVETSVTEGAFYGDRNNVTISSLIVEKYANPAQHGAIDNRYNNSDDGADNWLIVDNEVRWNHGTGIKVGKNARVVDNHVHHNGQLGVGAVGGWSVFDGNEISYNGEVPYYVDWERGGTKFADTHDIQLINNHVHHNDGPGLWADLNATNMLFANNTVVGNAKAGIYYEISYNAVIRDNYVEGNGFGFQPWLWGGGIVISSSPNVEIYGNTVVNNADGIAAVEQDRSRDPAAYGPLRIENLYVHDNTITMTHGHTGVAQDVGNTAVFQSRNNRFVNNTYNVPAGNFFEWDNRQMNLDAWRGYGLN